MNRTTVALILVAALVPAVALAQAAAPRPAAPRSGEPRPEPKPQSRPHSMRVPVDPTRIQVDDGDTVVVRWTKDDLETVRILGIDTPEARAFGRGAFATATQVELLRSRTVDQYGRTLGYLFLNGRNYSVLVVQARLAAESVTFYGDNGLPREAAEVLAAAKSAGPLPFEPPHAFRGRMREVSKWMQEKGLEAEQ